MNWIVKVVDFAVDCFLTQSGLKAKGAFGLFGWMTSLIYQAHGQYEKARDHFASMLQSEESLLL